MCLVPATALRAAPDTVASVAIGTIHVEAAGFTMGTTNLVSDEAANPYPFNQAAVKQDSAPALLGPDAKMPYFTVRFAMPIPPENETNNFAMLTGLSPKVFTHNHSPGFAILPNGDALAIYFSTPPGQSEDSTNTTFVQARLRYGSEEWDMPELFLDFKGMNDQSGLLWQDGDTTRFFGGGRGASPMMPFKMATSKDNGATWTLSLPQLDQPAQNFEAQPITCAFHAPDGSMYFAMDGSGAHSFLWHSADEGVHWHQMPGRTGGRHSTVVSLDDKGDLLSIGGKNASVNGWSPENTSTNWGESWSQSTESPFPPLSSGQRPSLIRLADGNLFFASDAYLFKANRPPPTGWTNGDGCFVAISTNNGASWHIKTLPVELPPHERGTAGTLGYVTTRQAPNGVIYILTTETQPCLQYEMNEAWIFSDAGDIALGDSGGVLKRFSEKYPNGKWRSEWGARICANGRYLLHGPATDYYENGGREHEVFYMNGRKMGKETYWAPDGKIIWEWQRDLAKNRATWTQFWPNGKKKSESNWNTRPQARDLARSFFGYAADGPAHQWDETGKLVLSGTFTNGMLASGMKAE